MSLVEIDFDPIRHEYTRRDTRVRVPSVTEILRETGISKDFEELTMQNGPVAEAIFLKRAIGIALHSDAHAYDDGDLDWTTVDPRVEPYLLAWVKFRENTGYKPVLRERRIYHPVWGFAGTLDGIFHKRFGGPQVLIDLKTGDVEASACRYQTAAYASAYLREHPEHNVALDRMAVQLCPELKGEPYRITLYERKTMGHEFRKFTAFVTTYWEQYERRLKAA